MHYKSMVWYTRLRYRLLPYIYSQAGDMYHKDGTLMRGLAMDFPEDETALNTGDQYMFGPAILVSPVYEMGATSREVYLPAGTGWYDLYTGQWFDGGQSITADAPLERMPLFARAGSIIPTGPEIQYSGQVLNAELTLNIYTGADGDFEVYEDDGFSYDYERGAWSRIPVAYDETRGVLTIGERTGSFNGMTGKRIIHVRWINGETGTAAQFDTGIAETFSYDGSAVTVHRPPW